MSTIYLKVDVDFNIGLQKGVPSLLSVFEKANIKTTFFVVMGPDTLYRHASRLNRRDYRKRLMSFNSLKLMRLFGKAYLKSMLLNQSVGPGFPDILTKIIEKGHEIGVHGYDHAEWAERCYEFSKTETEHQMKQAVSQFKRLFPEKNWIWGAPNWKCNNYMFNYLEKFSVPYSSDVRGCNPFYPLINGRNCSVLQFPVNLPCLHELVQLGITRDKIPLFISECLNGSYNLLCIHAYYEGLLERDLFVNVMTHLQNYGYQFKPLSHAYKNINSFKLSESEISEIQVAGGIKDVSCQKKFLSNNYFLILEDYLNK